MDTRALRERLEREMEAFRELEERLSGGDLSPAELKDLTRRHSALAPRAREIQAYLKLEGDLAEARAVLEDNSTDPDLKEMAAEEAARLDAELAEQREQIVYLLLPPDPNAGRGVVLEIRAGTGGEEAALFVTDLLRMYLRLAERKGWNVEILWKHETELGGAKEVALALSGPDVHEHLHLEGGGHRVQRIPVTESGGRIHTSAVTVAVMPEAEEEDVEIDESELEVDVYRASGAGGQHVNKTESAVRITHVPTGIVVTCQDERSQLKNRAKALRVLRTRLLEKQEEERHAREAAAKKAQIKSGDRSERIRTYNFPQGRVTDHRIGFTLYNLNAFLEGEMDELLAALLQAERDEKLKEIVQ